MLTFLLSLLVFAVAATALGIGVIIDGRRLRGSCGRADDCLCDAISARRCPRGPASRRRESGREKPVAHAVGRELDPPPTDCL